MADLSVIKLPNNSSYNLKDSVSRERSTEFIYGTQTAATNVWTGVTQDAALYDGKQILYFLPFNGTSTAATLNLTLAGGGTTGAKNVYFQSTTRMTTHYDANQQFRLVYHSALKIGSTTYQGWWSEPGRDTTTTNATQQQFNGSVKAGASALVAANIIVADSDGLYKHLKAGTAFDITNPILYLSSACNANTTTSSVYYDINFTVTTTQSLTLTAYKPVYIKGTLSGTTFTPVSTTPLTQTVPTAVDNYQYILLGFAYNTTAMRLFGKHPIFEYKAGDFRPYQADLMGTQAYWKYNASTDSVDLIFE